MSAASLRRLLRSALLPLVASAGLIAPVAAQFDVVSWTFSAPSSGSGTVNDDLMAVNGPDGPQCPGGSEALFTAVAPVDGVVVAKWTFISTDKFPGADYAVVVDDGMVQSVAGDAEFFGQIVTLDVTAGETFGFGVHSIDCIFGAGFLTLTDFLYLPTQPTSTLAGTQSFERFGLSLSALGDVDGNGTPDLVVGAPGGVVGGLPKGRATVMPGNLGVPLFTFAGDAAGDFFGQAVAKAGDVNDDGTTDVIVGAPRGDLPLPATPDVGYARVLSGADGSVLHTFYGSVSLDVLGSSVAGVGDLDGDDHDDVAAGAPNSDQVFTDGGLVRVYSGASGAVLLTLTGVAANDHFGAAVAGVGDVNGDGVPDIAVGAPGNDGAGNNAGRVTVHSGVNGSVLRTWNGQAPLSQFGSAVAAAGDADADGVGDVIVGAPGTVVIPVGSVGGRAHVFSGATGALLFKVEPTNEYDAQGAAVASAGDMDGDGHDDVVIGAPVKPNFSPEAGAGLVRIHSGRTGELMGLVVGVEGAEHFGFSVAGIGDGDGDGFLEVAAGAPENDDAATDAGELRTSDLIVPWTVLGHALAGSAGEPQLEGHGLLAAGTYFELKLTSGKPGGSGTLVMGLSEVNAAFKGGVLVPAPDILVPGLPINGAGLALLPATWPSGVPAGLQLWFQIWIADAAGPQGFAASNGVRATVP
jgi:hypothetical protein